MYGGGWWSYIHQDETQSHPQITKHLIKRVASYGGLTHVGSPSC